MRLNLALTISNLIISFAVLMPLLSKWTAHTSRRKTDENPKGAILFPLYNKAFKLLADSDIHLFCLGAAAVWAGEERVIDEPAEMSFRAKAGSEQSRCLGCKASRLQTLCFSSVLDWSPIYCPHKLSLLVRPKEEKKDQFMIDSTYPCVYVCACICIQECASVCVCVWLIDWGFLGLFKQGWPLTSLTSSSSAHLWPPSLSIPHCVKGN